MGSVAVLGVFVADAAYRAERMPAMGETVLGNSFALGPGGKGSNQAVAAGRLGAETTFIAKLGDDDFAAMAMKVWEEAGVTPFVQQVPDSYTGSAFIYVDEASGDNAIIIAPGAAATMTEADVDWAADVIWDADIFITQLEQPMQAARRALEIARQRKVPTILNPAPAAALPDGMLALCTYITPNETETEALTGIAVTSEADAERACAAFIDAGVTMPIITLGERGVYLAGHGIVPAFTAGEVVETTGAGDAFNGAFAAALAEGRDPIEAARFGCAAAGISVTRPGAAASMPTRAEVKALLG